MMGEPDAASVKGLGLWCEAVGLTEVSEAGVGKGDVQAVPLFESRAAARMGVDECWAGGGVRAVRRRERKRGGRHQGADREEIRVETGEGRGRSRAAGDGRRVCWEATF